MKEEEQKKRGGGKGDVTNVIFNGQSALYVLQQTHCVSSPPFNACRFVSALSRDLDFAVISEKSCYSD